jgi:hypothetical protein
MMETQLEDERDRTAFIEYFSEFCITAVWCNDGKLDYYVCARIDSPYAREPARPR